MTGENLKYVAGDYCAQHEAPAWKGQADFICLARIDDTPRWEQLWVRREEGGTFLVCCVPFFLYDLSLGDSVELDESNIVKGVVKRGGHITFRVWFGESSEVDRDRVVALLESNAVVLEWSSHNLLAMSCPQGAVALTVAEELGQEEANGCLRYESGSTSSAPSGPLNETFEIEVSYTQLSVFSSDVNEPFNDWTDEQVDIGYSWRPESVSFGMDDDGVHSVTVSLEPHMPPGAEAALRTFDVTLEVGAGNEVEVASIGDFKRLPLRKGSYHLRCEVFSSEGRKTHVHLTFVPRFTLFDVVQ